MSAAPISYDEPLFRPPSEAGSLIVQVTLGCSWNRCTFCEMYRSKRFRTRSLVDVTADLQAGAALGSWRRVFLADGDALVLSTRRLLDILAAIRRIHPQVHRVSAYALPANFRNKTVDELRQLRDAGLTLLYVGVESGDDAVLAAVNKGETAASTLDGLRSAREAGIRLSVMIISGLGGRERSRAHAVASAGLLNALQPEYASLLTLMHPFGSARFAAAWPSRYEPLALDGLLAETLLFVEQLELQQTIFRSDHASNHLALRGSLGRDKARLLTQLRAALDNPLQAPLRSEWSRRL